MSTHSNDGSVTLAGAVTRFGIRLLHELAPPSGGQNVFFSPLSVAAGLAMVHDGAKGRTRKAIARALGFDRLSQEGENVTFAALIKGVMASDPDMHLYVANGLWVRAGIPLNPGYVERSRAIFRAEVAVSEFGPPLAPAINGWVNRATHGKIARVVDRLDPAGALLLINAVYFKGLWARQFERRSTETGPFWLLNGKQKKCPMMNIWGRFSYYEDEDLQAIRLRYCGGRASMIIFLPGPQLGLGGLLERLSVEQWDYWAGSLPLSEQDGQSVHLQLPRFKIEYDTPLDGVLKTLGMKLAFDPDRADFGEMCPDCPERLFIDQANHRTYVDVNEEGVETEAATWTGLALGVSADPTPEMIVDRPFFFAIRDDLTGALLFAGAVYEP